MRKGSGSTRHAGKQTRLPEFEMLNSNKANGFVIHITEAPSLPPGPPSVILEAQDTPEQSPRQKPQPPPLAIPPKAYISDDQRPATPPSPLTPSPRDCVSASPAQVPLPRSSTNTPILVRSNSGATPVMRSMFPRYDPTIPITQQQYRPDIESAPGLASAMAVARAPSYRPPSYSQQANNRPSSAYLQSETARTKPADIRESPFQSADHIESASTISSPEMLLDLWDVANGQTAPEEVANTYSLELSWSVYLFQLYLDHLLTSEQRRPQYRPRNHHLQRLHLRPNLHSSSLPVQHNSLPHPPRKSQSNYSNHHFNPGKAHNSRSPRDLHLPQISRPDGPRPLVQRRSRSQARPHSER